MKQLLWSGSPINGLVVSKQRTCGRDSLGHISIWHRGGRRQRVYYRIIDFSNLLLGLPCIVSRIDYDPNRNTFVGVVCYVNGILSYILAYKGIACGDILWRGWFNTDNRAVNNGFGFNLRSFSERRYIYNFGSFGSSIIARAAGVSGLILRRFSQYYSVIKLPSKEERYFVSFCGYGYSGRVLENSWYYLCGLKAGRMRNLGWRPVVRGVAMNPVDHPHGGGEGRRNGRISVSPWGYFTNSSRNRRCSSWIIHRSDWISRWPSGGRSGLVNV